MLQIIAYVHRPKRIDLRNSNPRREACEEMVLKISQLSTKKLGKRCPSHDWHLCGLGTASVSVLRSENMGNGNGKKAESDEGHIELSAKKIEGYGTQVLEQLRQNLSNSRDSCEAAGFYW
jgi:hypothetical protein